ncbi:MAG: efflux RND transporter permease subunit [Terriglobia bacterium]
MNPSRIFILRPIATSLVMAGILLAGAMAYKLLPVSALPEVDFPTMQVTTFYPGASPDVMATYVTAPLERQLGEVPGLQQMTSTSSDGLSLITLQFDLGVNINVGEQDVQEALTASNTFLPPDLPTPPLYAKINPADTPILTLALTSNALPLSQVEDLADNRLLPKISQLPGVGLVSISGGEKPAVVIDVNPTQLEAYSLNLEDVRSAILDANVNEAKGNFDGTYQDYQIGSNDQLLSADQYKPLIIAYRNDAPVTLSNVATVAEGVENRNEAAWMNTTPAVIMNIQRQPGANIISVVNRIKSVLPQLTQTLPRAINVDILTDRTATIRASVKDVQFELMLTVALVVMVMFLFLRSLAATVIPAITVPLTIIGTFGAMYLLGFSLDNLSLMALTISTGFVVDDAVVMIENIVRYLEEGSSPLEAALAGSRQIAFTIISLTFSLIAVLIPLLFMGSIVGRLFREFAITLAATILISAVVTLALTPMLCSKLLKHRSLEEQSGFYRASERAWNSILAFYDRTLQVVLRHEVETLLVALATFVLTVLLYIYIPKGFFPIQDTGVIQGISQAAQTVSFDKMASQTQALDKVIMKDPSVESLSSFIGVDGTNTTLNSGRIQINLKPLNKRNLSASAVIRRLQPALAKVPGIKLYMQPVQDITLADRVSRTQYQYTLEDPNQDQLNNFAPRMLAALEKVPELRDVASDQENGGLEAKLVYNRSTAYRLGISPSTIDETLYDAYGQREVSTMYTQLNQYHVILEVKPSFFKSPQDLSDLFIRTGMGSSSTATGLVAGGSAGQPLYGPTSSATANAATLASTSASLSLSTIASNVPFGGQAIPSSTPYRSNEVPLSAFTHVVETTAPLTINQQGQFPVVTLSFNLAKNASLGDAMDAIDRVKQQLHMPAAIQGAFQGTAATFESSLKNEPLLVLAAIIAVYIVLGVLYESYIHPLTILSTLPSAGVGALLALMLLHTDFSIIALIGLVLLIGIVEKNAILMIDFALEAERKEGMTPVNAIYQACLLRFRPIMMTTLAAILGGVPLAVGSGMGSELRRPLGITIVGGLLLSQLLTLYTTPVIYIWLDRLGRRVRPGHDLPPGAEPAGAE